MLKVAILSVLFAAGSVYARLPLIQSEPQPFFDKELCEMSGDGTYDVTPSLRLVSRAQVSCRSGNLFGVSRYWLKRSYSSAPS